jgi:hypothetical protein
MQPVAFNPNDPEQVGAWVDAQSALLGLPLAPEHRPGVVRYTQLVMGLAPRVMDFVLTPHDESGSVFVPVSLVSPVPPGPSA